MVALVAAIVPTAGAAGIPLLILADRERRRQRAAQLPVSADVRILCDLGGAATCVFLAIAGLMATYWWLLADSGATDPR